MLRLDKKFGLGFLIDEYSFCKYIDVSPFLGGTERITDTLCREFRKRCLCRCYLAYYEGIDSLYKKTVLMEDYVLEAGRMWRF